MAESPIQALLESPDQDQVRAELAAYFGRNPGRYLRRYEQLRAAGPGSLLLAWNWAAFGYGFPWFFFRKLFGLGALFALPPLAAYLGLPWAGNASLVVALFFPVLADHWYVRAALARVARVQGLEPAERLDILRRQGGVSPLAGAAAFALYLGLLVLSVLGAIQQVLPGLLRP
jgi:hypothetical protein